MAKVTSFSTLKDAIADWTLRTDFSDGQLDQFVDLAESVLKRDPRVRRLRNISFEVDAETETLPSDYVSLEALYHDGATYYGDIEIVDPGILADVTKREGSNTGVPTHAAINDGVLRFAPPPDQTYTLRLSYWETIDALSDNVQSNWLLDRHPDVYLYACLVETAPYLRDDQRIPVWKSNLEERLEALHRDTQRGQYGGSLVRRPVSPIP